MLLVTGPDRQRQDHHALRGDLRNQPRPRTRSSPSRTRSSTSSPGVLQIPVNEKKGLTFARGLRSILRHDPDKIMVGEIRDPETANIAVQSALTGHLVFTTVHANNVFDVIGRFMHMNVDLYSFVSALNGILAQRLVRLICPALQGARATVARAARRVGARRPRPLRLRVQPRRGLPRVPRHRLPRPQGDRRAAGAERRAARTARRRARRCAS